MPYMTTIYPIYGNVNEISLLRECRFYAQAWTSVDIRVDEELKKKGQFCFKNYFINLFWERIVEILKLWECRRGFYSQDGNVRQLEFEPPLTRSYVHYFKNLFARKTYRAASQFAEARQGPLSATNTCVRPCIASLLDDLPFFGTA